MFDKYSSDSFQSQGLQDLHDLYSNKLSRVAGNFSGTYAEPLLRQLYTGLAGHVDDSRVYAAGTFPPLLVGGNVGNITYANSPRLSRAFTDVLHPLAGVISTISNGKTGCLGISSGQNSHGSFPGYDHILSKNRMHSSNTSVEHFHDLFSAQKQFLEDPKGPQYDGLIHQCSDGICSDCPVCAACGEELKRSVNAVTTAQDLSNPSTLDAPRLAPVHFNSIITTSNVLAKHLLHLGNTEDTKDDPRFLSHGLAHGNASSLMQSIAKVLHHAGIHDYEETGRRGGFPRLPSLEIPGRSRFTTPSDPSAPVPTGTYNAGKERKRQQGGTA